MPLAIYALTARAFGIGVTEFAIMGLLLKVRLADRSLIRAFRGTLTALALVLGLMTFASNNHTAAVIFFGLLGAAGLATVAPLQMWMLSKSEGVGQSLTSRSNTGAFNLGNAIGAWAGGMVIDQGPGLAFVAFFAALFPAAAIAVAAFAAFAATAERRSAQSPFAHQPVGSNNNAD